ncbi:hypothetical protein HanPSC8_Chr10g0448551 [Helianthus annuus]|nr:hypothetical protein HanPSC8_Chr10g0448551 [Helianthus annuus]
MLVMNSANNLNLRLKLALTLSTTGFQLFNRHFFPIRKHPSMNIPKPTLSKKIRFRKPIGRHR